ncbi:hypothetical protein PoB_007105700 [Plakobranchus ocellatus]|uniref:Uncharacterized protein n=1 Tax=Plakobranchus ocellatus TaxID=259542 RepID=A0AAV4DJU2_9GAST|nr:hypothetical protein PoB_007105700 [Plakobranchus ocellatus]
MRFSSDTQTLSYLKDHSIPDMHYALWFLVNRNIPHPVLGDIVFLTPTYESALGFTGENSNSLFLPNLSSAGNFLSRVRVLDPPPTPWSKEDLEN